MKHNLSAVPQSSYPYALNDAAKDLTRIKQPLTARAPEAAQPLPVPPADFEVHESVSDTAIWDEGWFNNYE